jgi:hypothetical protein
MRCPPRPNSPPTITRPYAVSCSTQTACAAPSEPIAAFFPSTRANRLIFFCPPFDDRGIVAYTFLAECLDPFFGTRVLPIEIPNRTKRFLPQCCRRLPSPGLTL